MICQGQALSSSDIYTLNPLRGITSISSGLRKGPGSEWVPGQRMLSLIYPDGALAPISTCSCHFQISTFHRLPQPLMLQRYHNLSIWVISHFSYLKNASSYLLMD